MKSSAEKDQRAIRLQMKQVCRVALELHKLAEESIRNINALGLSFADPEEDEESNCLSAMDALKKTCETFASAITRGADIGNNIG